MTRDPVLINLVKEVDRAAAALRSYLQDHPNEDDLVSLREAENEFRRSNYTVRRWAKDEGLGVVKGGKWYLRRSLVREHKLR